LFFFIRTQFRTVKLVGLRSFAEDRSSWREGVCHKSATTGSKPKKKT